MAVHALAQGHFGLNTTQLQW